jgi:D-serine deaminase-like pyridoxal phosphate-dependent protein
MKTASEIDLGELLFEEIDWRYKGFPPTARSVTVGTVGDQGWNALGGDLLMPLLLLKEPALDHNIRTMARYCADQNVSLAPHGKTPVAPQIVQRQLDAGAWGITAATLHQARVFRAFGVRRILIANEVLEPLALEWMAREMDADSSVEIFCLVDSLDGVKLMDAALVRAAPRRPLPVLIEWGAWGARAGVRTMEGARAIARRLRDSRHLRLAGVEGYEGSIAAPGFEERLSAVDRYLGEMRGLTEALHDDGAFDGLAEIIVSAGGSIFMDRVVELLGSDWSLDIPVRTVLRSGAYVGHDDDEYERFSGLGARGGGTYRFQPALELWGMVLSRPEDGLAVAGFGKRDASYDIHLPIPFVARRGTTSWSLAGKAEVTRLNDQHAYVRLTPDADLAVGDVLGCQISHACTIFDKWRLLPLVDDQYRVTGAIRTFF